VRTPDGPRQRTLCYLGRVERFGARTLAKNHRGFQRAGRSAAVEARSFGGGAACERSGCGPGAPEKDAAGAHTAVGPCYLGWHLFRRLKLARRVLCQHDGHRRSGCGLVARGGHPGDQPAVRTRKRVGDRAALVPGHGARRWAISCIERKARSTTLGSIDAWIACCRRIPNWNSISSKRYGDLFAAQFDVMLYDLTSTYVEGEAQANPLMRRGYSRDHRPDCLQLVLALIVNAEGFPCSL
jgi:hypothetical protein